MTDAHKLKARLEIGALRFLLWQKRCVLATMERGYSTPIGRPDVFGMTQGRETIEIEIKVSMADLRANKNKAVQRYFARNPERGPNTLYYMVPTAIAKQAVFEIEEHAGLIEMYPSDAYECRVAKRPKKIHTRKIGLVDAARLVRDQSGTMLGLVDKLFHEKMANGFLNDELRQKEKHNEKGH